MILVDSDVLIAHLRGWREASDWLVDKRRTTGPLGVSAVSVVEVAGGMRPAERRQVAGLFASMLVFPVAARVAWTAAEYMRRYRRSHSGIEIGDYLIAATAESEGCELATLNVRHYPMFQGLRPPFAL